MVRIEVAVAKLQQDVAIVSTKLDEHLNTQKTDFERVYCGIEKLNTKLDNLPESLDKKYATKEELNTAIVQIKDQKVWRNNLIPFISGLFSILLALIIIFDKL